MKTDIIYALVKIAEGIHDSKSVEKALEKISINEKLSKNLIAAIYSWIFEKSNRDASEKNYVAKILILSADELEQIGIENYNYILHLYNIGLLDISDIEKIIEQALVYPEGELDDEQLNLMVLSLFLETNSNLPPGSRFLLYSSDTIN